MLMAFLQRIVNGGGHIEREYALGKGALDLWLQWRDEQFVIEVKLRRGTDTEQDAYEQVLRYLDHLGLDEGWLVLFDLRKSVSWDDKLFIRDEQRDGKLIHVVGV